MAANDYLQGQLFQQPAEGGGIHRRIMLEKESGAANTGRHDGLRSRFSNEEVPGRQSGQQLPMFMSARQITDQYQPLDADREDSYGEDYTDERAGEVTGRPRRTDGMTNERLSTGVRNYYGAGTSQPFQRRSNMDDEATESDEQLWDRKYQESSMSPRDKAEEWGENFTPKYYRGASMNSDHLTRRSYTNVSRSRTNSEDVPGGTPGSRHREDSYEPKEEHYGGGPSLRDSVMSQGVKSPVRLGQTIGSMGKPEIVGGHHRLSVMQAERPDDLMPVLHDQSLGEAKRMGERSKITGKGYRYT